MFLFQLVIASVMFYVVDSKACYHITTLDFKRLQVNILNRTVRVADHQCTFCAGK